MESRTSLTTLRVLGFGMAAAAVVLTALASFLSRHNPAVVAPLAMSLPFIAVAVLDAVASDRNGHA
jgi:hypothetical protein